MLENYIIYLKFLEKKLTKFFDKQKPYIRCQKGCGLCCQNAQFPYSKLEIDYLMTGAWQLDLETKKLVAQNINRIIQEKKNFNGKPDEFKYDCPFLINNVCSVYKYRGIICRTFGLMYMGEDNKAKIPFCCFKGYNYANVVKDGSGVISSEKVKALGDVEEPVAFNISYKFLTCEDFEQGFKIKFGEKKPLIDWFIEDKEENC